MNSLVRVFLVLLTLSFVIKGVHFGAVIALDVYKGMEKSSLKKEISVKPESIKEKQALIDPWSIDEDEFTFFDILDDPSMSKFIGLSEVAINPQKTNNSKKFDLNSKIRKTSAFRSNNVNSKKEPNSAIYNIENQKETGSIASGFVLQVGSFKTLERANLLKSNLDKKGYPVFVMTARTPEEGEVWHRVVIGRFEKKETAVKTAMRMEKIENLDSLIKWQEGQNFKVSP